MKKRFAYLAVAILAAGAATSVYAQTSDPMTTSVTAATAQGKEKYPLLAAAKKGLLVSRKALVGATSDYQGHRTAAIAHIDAAIKEIDAGVTAADAKSSH